MKRTVKRMSKAEKAAARLFRVAVRAKGGCLLESPTDYCDNMGLDLDAHHVIPKRTLKIHTGTLDEADRIDITWDPRNGVPLCRRHHDLITIRSRTITADRLPESVVTFARENGLTWKLEREIPGFTDPEAT